MAAPTIQIKRGILSNLPGLKVGEPGFTTNTYDLYVGLDGTSNNNKFFGSHRYWTKETVSSGSSVRLVEASGNGNNFIALKSPDTLAQDTTYTFPATPSAGFVLQTDGSGVLSWVSAASASGAITGITVRDEGSTVGTAASITALNFVGEGIVATGSGIGATVTLGAASATVAGVSSYNSSDFYFSNTYQVGITTATSSTKGIASFNSTDFYINAGSVGIVTESIQDMAGSAITAGINTNITVTYDDANNRINHNVNTATTSVLGVASFSSTNFTVTTGAVSIAVNAVGLGTNTYGQYAKSIVGGLGLNATTANADDGTDYTIDVNTGAGITITSDAVAFKNAASLSSNTLTKWDSGNTQLTNSSITDSGTLVSVNSNLYVSGTLSIGGTSVFINAATLQVKDRDIVLGITTDGSGNDISTDLSATHGGISIASTQGSPIFDMPQLAGINSNPFTYKQFMWISSATGAPYAGVGTDAWISNYAIGIGTLTVRNGSRLTVGAGFTVFDTYLDAQDIRSRNINNTGFVTTTNLKTTNLYDSTNTNGTSGQFLTVTGTGIGWTTISGVSGGAIAVATRATTVDTTTAASGTFYPGLFSSSTGVNGATVNVDAGISYVSNTDTLTVQNLTVPGTLIGTATTSTRSTTVDTTTAASGTFYPGLFSSSTGVNGATVNVDAGISYVSNTDTLTATNLTVTGTLIGAATTATRATLTDTTTAPAGTFYPAFHTSGTGVASTATYVDTGISYVSNTDTLTATNLTVTGTLIGTATTATKITTTTSTATGYIPFVASGTGIAGESLLVDANIQYNGSTDSLIVQNAQHSTVKALDGTSAITITSTTGAVGIASDLTVSGNLYIAGTATQVNTTNLVVEDRVIELGKVQGTAPTDTTWDLGILFNYYTASTNKKASVYWEGGVSRFLFASDVTESVLGINLPDSGAVGLGTTTPQLTSPVFAPIEVGALWMNDTLGQSVVASYLALNAFYTGAPADRYLQNITVDAGVF